MVERLASLWARVSLRMRICSLLLVGLLAVQGSSLWWSLADRAAAAQRVAIAQQAQRVTDLVQVLDAIEPAQRNAVAAGLRYPRVSLDPPGPLPGADGLNVKPIIEEVWLRRLGARPAEVISMQAPLRWVRPRSGSDGIRLQVDTRLADGQALRAEVEVVKIGLIGDALLWPFVAISLGTALLVAVSVRWALNPLNRLSAGALAIGARLDTQPLAETGPPEVRHAAQVLNRMQAQLREYISGRVQALAAMSHDLRTPITRLRLRAELLPDPAQKEAFTRNLLELEQMVQSTLDYLSGGAQAVKLEPLDLDGLIALVVEDVEALGTEVAIDGATGMVVLGDSAQLRRALTNLLRNAVVHGCAPGVRVEAEDHHVSIHVEDRGPGIPGDELQRVTQPYYRLDAARGRDTGGAGLGLAVASEVALSHGGRLRLANREGGGLQASLILNRAPTAAEGNGL